MESLRRYDENFLSYYSYLDHYIPWTTLRGKCVLEVGLGYGTVSQKLVESGAEYTGLDVAANQVALVNHRLRQSGLAGKAVQGNILAPPLASESFDAIVAVRCLRHTGNIRDPIASCRSLLAPRGLFVGMVYYAYSYRQLWQQPARTIATCSESDVDILARSTTGEPFRMITLPTGRSLRPRNLCRSKLCARYATALQSLLQKLRTQTRSIRSNCGSAIPCWHRRCRACAAWIYIGPVSKQADQTSSSSRFGTGATAVIRT
jgi:SAM-dependent methyltransferase